MAMDTATDFPAATGGRSYGVVRFFIVANSEDPDQMRDRENPD